MDEVQIIYKDKEEKKEKNDKKEKKDKKERKIKKSGNKLLLKRYKQLTSTSFRELERIEQNPVTSGSGFSLLNVFCCCSTGNPRTQEHVEEKVNHNEHTGCKREYNLLWTGYLWKMNSNIDPFNAFEVEKLKNWRLRRFNLCEYTDVTGEKKGVISYMREKEDRASFYNFELHGNYEVTEVPAWEVNCTKEEASQILLDNETYEVAYGRIAGSSQNPERKHNHIPDKVYTIKIASEQYKAPNLAGSTDSNQISPVSMPQSARKVIYVAASSKFDRDMWFEQLLQFHSDNIKEREFNSVNIQENGDEVLEVNDINRNESDEWSSFDKTEVEVQV